MGKHLTIGVEPERPWQVRPCPPDFPEIFIREGWRGVELEFGAHTRVNKRWLAECGGDRLKQERQAFLKARSARMTEERQRTIERHRAWRHRSSWV
jgi:hypothetical protein